MFRDGMKAIIQRFKGWGWVRIDLIQPFEVRVFLGFWELREPLVKAVVTVEVQDLQSGSISCSHSCAMAERKLEAL